MLDPSDHVVKNSGTPANTIDVMCVGKRVANQLNSSDFTEAGAATSI